MMILAIGPNNARRPRSAFTLIELVLVLALLVVVVSIVVPHMTGFIRGQALSSEVRRVASVMHAGQARAVSEGVPVMFWLDQKQNRYGIELESSGKNGDLKAQSFTADENVQLAVLNTGIGTAVTFKNLPAVRFMPDGSVDEGSPGTIQLKDSGGRSLWLMESSNRNGYEIRDSN